MSHPAHRSGTGREPLLSFTIPEAGDRVRIWYVSHWSDGDRVQEVHGTAVGESRGAEWYTAVEFETAAGVGYRLTRRRKESWVLRKETPTTEQFRRVSARFGGVVAVRTSQGPRLPPSPFGVSIDDADEQAGVSISPATVTIEASGQTTLGDYERAAVEAEARADAAQEVPV